MSPLRKPPMRPWQGWAVLAAIIVPWVLILAAVGLWRAWA